VSLEKATFGAGCFWGVESAFREIAGVVDAAVGYEGGTIANPTYQDVCTDETGHAEVVELTYDPALVGYDKLVDAFYGLHNPTTRDRQGPDVGSQYRSVIFVHSPEQERIAREVTAKAQSRFNKPIVTQIEAAQTFYRAEDYHQQYLAKRGLRQCHF
jgi:peptide-methionine (S)-S-oxide reductase